VPAWNGNFVAYTAGQQVTYNGSLYRCWQSHTSQPNWDPVSVPALWQFVATCSTSAIAQVVAPRDSTAPVAKAWPNISRNGEPVHLHVRLARPDLAHLTLFTLQGEKVYETSFHGLAGDNSLIWDLKNSTGQNVTSGLYVYVVRTTGPDGNPIVVTGKLTILH